MLGTKRTFNQITSLSTELINNCVDCKRFSPEGEESLCVGCSNNICSNCIVYCGNLQCRSKGCKKCFMKECNKCKIFVKVCDKCITNSTNYCHRCQQYCCNSCYVKCNSKDCTYRICYDCDQYYPLLEVCVQCKKSYCIEHYSVFTDSVANTGDFSLCNSCTNLDKYFELSDRHKDAMDIVFKLYLKPYLIPVLTNIVAEYLYSTE